MLRKNYIVRTLLGACPGTALFIAFMWAMLMTGCKPGQAEGVSSGNAFSGTKAQILAAVEQMKGVPNSPVPMLQIPPATDPPKLQIQALVDLSLSMQAFVPPADDADNHYSDSNYRKVLRALANQSELLAWKGWGNPQKESPNTVTLLASPPDKWSQYSWANNDYAAMINELLRQKTRQMGIATVYLIVSDGVQSQSEAAVGGTLGPTGQAIKNWVQEGGAVDLRMFSSPYYGTYYSEVSRTLQDEGQHIGTHVAFDEPNRPFMLLALIDTPAGLPVWNQFWQEREGLRDLTPLRNPVDVPRIQAQASYEIRPEEKLPPADHDLFNILGPTTWRKFGSVDLGSDWQLVYAAQVKRTFSSGEDEPLPVDFDILAGTDGGPAAVTNPLRLRQMADNLHPEFSTYSLASGTWGTGPRWQQFKEPEELADQDARVAPARPDPGAASAQKALVTLGYSVAWRHFGPLCVFLTLTPPAAPPPDYSDPADDYTGLSTIDDSVAANSDKTYQLETLVEEIRDADPPVTPKASGAALFIY